jgi:hypothetical protein
VLAARPESVYVVADALGATIGTKPDPGLRSRIYAVAPVGAVQLRLMALEEAALAVKLPGELGALGVMAMVAASAMLVPAIVAVSVTLVFCVMVVGGV